MSTFHSVYCPKCFGSLRESNVVGEHHDEWEETYYCPGCNEYVFSCQSLSAVGVLERKERLNDTTKL